MAKNSACEAKFAYLLRIMGWKDGIPDAQPPIVQRYGGSVVPLLTGDRKPSLAEIRNSPAHGDPFDGWPWSVLFELVRHLIR